MACFTGSFEEPDLTDELVSEYIAMPAMGMVLRGVCQRQLGDESDTDSGMDAYEETDGVATDEGSDFEGDEMEMECEWDSGVDMDVDSDHDEWKDYGDRGDLRIAEHDIGEMEVGNKAEDREAHELKEAVEKVLIIAANAEIAGEEEYNGDDDEEE